MKDKLSEQRVELLHPKIRNEVKYLIEQAEAIIDTNLAIRVVQGLRTFGEQTAIYNQPFDGIDNNGNGKVDEKAECVTNAKAGQSYHNYGLAFDFCFLYLQADGAYKYDDVKSWLVGKNHNKVTNLFKANGYGWGGDFKTITDQPHLEKTFGYSWKKLLQKYENNDFIEGTTYIKL